MFLKSVASPELGCLLPVALKVQDSSRLKDLEQAFSSKIFQEASGDQIWAAMSGREFQSQERGQNAFSPPEGL